MSVLNCLHQAIMKFVTPQAQNHVFRERSKQPAPFNDTIDFLTLEELKTLEKKGKKTGMSDSESDNDPLDDRHSYDEVSGTILTSDTVLSCLDDDEQNGMTLEMDEDCNDEATKDNSMSYITEEDAVQDMEEEEEGESVTMRRQDEVVKKSSRKKKNVVFKMANENWDDSW